MQLKLILQQLQACESILERVHYILRKTEKDNPDQLGNKNPQKAEDFDFINLARQKIYKYFLF